ncbi:MAG: hypothetical protein PHW74_04705 [Desulfobacca sp.]|nr:hypothetical protein [Desulfobacca sp.]
MITVWLLGVGVSPGWSADLQVLRLGLSRVKDTSLLTIVLSKAVQPQVSPVTAVSAPQLVIIFPDAVATRLPTDLPGDQTLVRQVRTLFTPGKNGVRIILDLIPERPYVFWRQMRPGPNGLVQLIIGLKSEPRSESRQPPGLNLTKRSRPGEPPAPPAQQPPTSDYGYKMDSGRLESDDFQGLGRLAPNAVRVFHFLEQHGWTVARQNTSDQPGKRLKQEFLLTHSRYSILTIRFTHIAGSSVASPDINFLTLSTENLPGSEAQRYREMTQWSVSQIKKHYEDIGDYYSDGLQPLRVVLRRQSQAETLRDFDFFRQFLAAACPQNPKLANDIMTHLREKVNQRLEGVQYTLSEDPLIILNMVDFLFVRVYFLGRVS